MSCYLKYNSMNFKLACQVERSDESEQNILQYVVRCTSCLSDLCKSKLHVHNTEMAQTVYY